MEALLRGGLMAEDCTFRERTDLLTSGLVPTYLITHTPTGSEFDLRVLPERTWSGRLHLAPTREDVSLVETWARETAEWAQTPDLWALAATLPGAADNSPFTRAERDESPSGWSFLISGPSVTGRALATGGLCGDDRWRPTYSEHMANAR